MLNFVHDIPTKVYFGKGAIRNLDSSLRQYGRNVLLVYGGGSIKRTGLYDEIMKILNEGGFIVTELSGVEPNPRIGSVEKGVALCRQNDIEVVLAVGGAARLTAPRPSVPAITSRAMTSGPWPGTLRDRRSRCPWWTS